MTDALGGAAPNPAILAGGGRAVQRVLGPLKASGLSHWQVVNPRLLRLSRSAGFDKQISEHHPCKTFPTAPTLIGRLSIPPRLHNQRVGVF